MSRRRTVVGRRNRKLHGRSMYFQLDNGHDYVNISDDSRFPGTTWTRSEKPPPIQTAKTELILKMTSDDIYQEAGFLANYSRKGNRTSDRAASESMYACSSTLDSGTITSPGYPNDYPNSLQYSWIIMQPEGCTIQLNFSEFLLQRRFDYVSVYNVFKYELGDTLGQWSGEELPPSVQSTSNRMLITMKTDDSISSKGFAASFNTNWSVGTTNPSSQYPHASNQNKLVHSSSQPDKFTLTDCLSLFGLLCLIHYHFAEEHIFVQTLTHFCFHKNNSECRKPGNTKCTIHHTLPASEFVSPGFPLGFHEHLNMTWHISQPEGCIIRVQFALFKIWQSHDVVAIYDRQCSQNRLLGQWTGYRLPPPVLSTSNNLLVELISDGAYRSKGFSATYTSVTRVRGEIASRTCTTLIVEPTDSIASPNYPQDYPANLNCTWTISQPQGCVIRLKFEDFKLESGGDYVRVYDGPPSNENLLDTWTGTSIPSPRVSTGNTLTVEMHTNSLRQFRGFYAVYENFSVVQQLAARILRENHPRHIVDAKVRGNI
ncbi:tolloid-like protein 1 [Clonorchis sinensis]|uniref:Tolloid-like protein 1 n=1 Tax=Clonorchis sinensis TaxID=79923 RepID=G7YX95_CLOSI|nr:tolloid-like protein 1 [Clonorchis sinensis]